MPAPLDSDLLRTFLAITDSGSFTAGAERIGRSQSAVSLQIKKLEQTIGARVFARHGRGVALSAEGERLEPRAREAVALLDDTLAELSSGTLSGRLRLGVPDEHSQTVLAEIVAAFAARHPAVELDIQCAVSTGFAKSLARGELDLALYEVEAPAPHLEVLREESTHWVSARAHATHRRSPLPVALFDRDCWWRDAALDALRRSGRPYRIVYSAESIGGVTAAIRAGAAIGLLNRSAITPDMLIVSDPKPLGRMPKTKLILETPPGPTNPLASAMADAIRRAFGRL